MSKKVVYLLGAGCSHAMTEGKAPLTSELGRHVGEVFSKEQKEKFCFNEDKFELFLTHIDVWLKLNSEKEGYRELKQNRELVKGTILNVLAIRNIGNVNEEDNWIEPTKPADEFTNIFFRENDSIITTNYDCYLENILLQKNKWTANIGYTQSPLLRITARKDLNKDLSGIKFYKIHGSLNFQLLGYQGKAHFIGYDFMHCDFPFLHKVPECAYKEYGWFEERKVKVEGAFLVPTYMKPFNYPFYYETLNEAAKKLTEADVLVLIGISLREEDKEVLTLVKHLNLNSKLVIIDPNYEEIHNRFYSVLGIDVLHLQGYYPKKSLQEAINDVDLIKQIYG